MKSPETEKSKASRFRITEPVIFFTAYYFCVWLIIDPKLIYHAFGRTLYYPTFSTGLPFLTECLTKTGGPINYINGFLSQAFYFSPTGAAIITLTAFFFWLISKSFFRLTKSYQVPLICYLYPAALLALYTRYSHQMLIVLTVLSSLIFLSIYMRIASSNSLFDLVKFAAVSLFLFYFAGSAFIIFGLLAAFYELFIRRRTLLGILFCVLTLAAQGSWKYFFDIQTRFPNLQLLSASQTVDRWLYYTTIIIYLLGFLMLIQIALYKYAFANKSESKGKKPAYKGQNPVTDKSRPYLIQILRITASLLLLLLVFLVSFKKTDKLALNISYHSHNKMWEKVLELADKCPKNIYSSYWNHDINLALYHTGQLGSKMFSYPQRVHALLLTTEGANQPISLTTFAKRIDLFLELGHVGVSERLSYELLESTNECPFVLEKLALINLTKGEKETAISFLNSLSKDLIYGRKAKKLLDDLRTDPQMTSNKHLQHLRSVATDIDNVVYDFDADSFFVQLLNKNKNNKMAFEYMMAFYLLTGQVNKIAENISRLDDFGEEKIPFHYEEALALYIGSTRNRVDLKGHIPSMTTLQYIKQFDNIYKPYAIQGNKQAARSRLIKDYKGSYIFYFVFEMQRVQK